ncbi:MAG: large subunit ribosomal protein [Campylobacterota bacterium]|nr:large subunit ribosomal protein [Campylobacterota bacterium]
MEFLAEKIGMSRTIGDESVAVTLLKVKDMKIVEALEDKAIAAYNSGKSINKSIEGQQKKYNLSKEFNKFVTLDISGAQVGNLDLSSISQGATVKVSLNTKGRGFSGVIKRHNFQGGPGAHGSRFHRSTGSIGNREFPGRVQKGKKMPGHYGNTQVTVKNSVVSFDSNSNVIVLKGCVPGANGSLARVKVVS